jgi:hypothetical protein
MVKRIIEFVVLLIVAAGVGPLGASMWQWSTTAGNNATADPSINWSEGMAPSAVNDSARAMMAALAGWRNDISATNTTAGTSTAYTLTTSEGVNTTPVNGQMLSFIANATNGAAPTLTVDGGNTYPIWLNGSAAPSGTLVAGTPYRVAFSNSNSAWLLEAGYGSPFTVPLGALLWSTAPTAPNSNFVAPSGQCISTTTYAAYWVQQGSPASGACPGGQFAIIDMRGRVAAALDTLNASAANRITVTGCGTAFNTVGTACTAGETQTLITANLPPYTPSGSIITGTTEFNAANVSSASGGGNSVTTGGFSATNPLILNAATYTGWGFTGTAQGGTSTPFSKLQPMIGLIPYLRIL